MILSALQGEEKIFLGRLEDMLWGADIRPRFSAFLSSRQLSIAAAFVEQRHCDAQACFYGGYSGAVRPVLGFFPAHMELDTTLFPIEIITVFFRSDASLTHRDFLGALMGMLIKREAIGDLVVESGAGKCTIFLLESVADIVVGELKKVGNIGVRCEKGQVGEVNVVQHFEPIHGTVSSARIDCLVALVTGLSREKSAKLISSELVQLDHITISSISKSFETGGTLVIRGYGKYVIDKIGNPTRKGLFRVDLRKYK